MKTNLSKARIESLRKYLADSKNAKTVWDLNKAFNEHKERMKVAALKKAA